MQASDSAEKYENMTDTSLKQAIDQAAKADRSLHPSFVNPLDNPSSRVNYEELDGLTLIQICNLNILPEDTIFH